MRLVAKLVEQLDLASVLLKQSQPSAARLALILTDNVVEMLAHERCVALLREDASGPAPDANRVAANKAKSVLGKRFAPKIDFLERRNELDTDESRLATFAHQMRNEAYHLGIVHEPVILPIASAYFQMGCAVLPRLRKRWVSFDARKGLPPIIAKHMPIERSRRLHAGPDVDAIAASLSASVPPSDRPFGEALRASVAETLAEIQDLLAYYVGRDPEVRSIPEAMGNIQFWDALFEHAPFRRYSIADPAQHSAWRRRRKEMQHWRPRINVRTLDRWQHRSRGISSRAPPGNNLQRYLTLRDEIAPFEKAVKHAVSLLDEEIERQVDERRERR